MTDLTPETLLSVRIPCPTCHGVGTLPGEGKHHCGVCQRLFPEVGPLALTLPCGHLQSHLVPGLPCEGCRGKGHETREVTLGELGSYFRSCEVMIKLLPGLDVEKLAEEWNARGKPSAPALSRPKKQQERRR